MTAAVVRKELSPAELEHTLATIDIPICPAIVLQVMAEAQRLGVTKIGIVGNEQFMN